MTSFLTKVPALKLLLLIMLGLAIGWITDIDSGFLPIVLIVIAVVFTALLLLRHFFLCYILTSIAIGIFLWPDISDSRPESPRKVIPEMPAIIEGEIVKIITKKNNYVKCLIEGWVDAKALPRINTARIMLSVYNIDESMIKTGLILAANATLRLPRPSQLPSDFNEVQYCTSLDVQWIARASGRSLSVLGYNSSFLSFVNGVSGSIKNMNAELYSPDVLGIVNALTTGDKSLLDYSHRKLFSYTGTAHVLAISGLHVGLIALVILALTGWIKVPWLNFAFFSIAIISFVLITNAQPSAMRAGAMIIAYRAATLLQRKIAPVNAISVVVIIFILISPEIILSVGFQMSVSAILGISLMFGPVRNHLRNIIDTDNMIVSYIINSISLSIAASIVISPIVAVYFNTFSIISPIANLIIIPLMSLSLAYSLFAVLTSTVSIWAASLFAASSELLINLSIDINHLIAAVPYAYIMGDSTVFISVLVSALLIIFVFASSLKQRLSWTAVVLAAVVILLQINSDSHNAVDRIILRDKIVAAFIPDDSGNMFVIISDRKPGLNPIRDFALEEYIVNLGGDVRVAVNGIAGISILDEIKKRRDIESVEINIDDFNRISRQLSPGLRLNQLIEYR